MRLDLNVWREVQRLVWRNKTNMDASTLLSRLISLAVKGPKLSNADIDRIIYGKPEKNREKESKNSWVAFLLFCLTWFCAATISFAQTEPQTKKIAPQPDHVVIVIEENHAYRQIIGNRKKAPFLNELAKQGALFTRSFAVTHPSQPNYLALFSGSTQGSVDDRCPAPGSPFVTKNLADELEAEDYTFLAFAEDLPSSGFPDCSSRAYVRKHAPWANWTHAALLGKPFFIFPSFFRRRHAASPRGSRPALPLDDFSSLPTVSFVVPNLLHDMHDGSIQQGDKWLRKYLAGYVRWCATHNSLLMVTFDEDNDTPVNRIPTLFVGPMVKPGSYSETITHYNLLRTVEAMYGLPGAGDAHAAPILDVWKTLR